MHDLLQAILLTFFDVENLGLLIGASALAFLMGLLPGLSATEAMIILLPFTFAMGLDQSMIMLSAAYASGFVGGSLTSIVFGIPGSTTNMTTVLDGHALHKQGRTIYAVTVAATSSAVAGILALLLVIALMPVMEPFSLLFGPAEWFAFVIFGLVVLSFSGESPPLHGLMSGGLGLLFGTIGLSATTGSPRYTFGFSDLWGGIPIIAAFIALFPIAEALWMASGREAEIGKGDKPDLRTGQGVEIWSGIKDTLSRFGTLVVSGAIGWLVGVIPGVGATLANVLAYFVIKDTARDKSKFGKGDIRGLIAAESSNNASVGGALLPALALGIPGSIATAILLSVFMINGVQPGTNIFSEHLQTTWVIILSIGGATVISSLFVIAGAWRIVGVIQKVSPQTIAPIIVFIGFMAVYLARSNANDLLIAAVLAVIGYLMKLCRFSRISFVVALMLGSIVESSFFQALSIGRGSYTVFFRSPTTWIIWLAVIACIALHLYGTYGRRRQAKSAVAGGGGPISSSGRK